PFSASMRFKKEETSASQLVSPAINLRRDSANVISESRWSSPAWQMLNQPRRYQPPRDYPSARRHADEVPSGSRSAVDTSRLVAPCFRAAGGAGAGSAAAYRPD